MRKLCACLLLSAGVALPAAAQEPPPPADPPASGARLEVTTDAAERPVAIEPVRGDGKVLLTLDDAVAIALRANLGIAVQRFERQRSRYAVFQNVGIYDLRAEAFTRAFDSTSPTGSQLESSAFDQQIANVGVAQLLPTGGDVNLFWNNQRQATNNLFQTLNPQFRSEAGFEYTQPLLRDFGRVATEYGIRLARLDSRVSGAEFERTVATTVRDVETAYWNLVEAREQLVVAEESLGLARELHERNRIQVEVGTMAPLEMVQSEAAIALREEDIIRAGAGVEDAADQLRRLLNFPAGELWELPIEPQTPPEIERLAVDLDAAIATALAERWELGQQQLLIERGQVDAAYLRNQTLPDVDLAIRYNYSGLGGDLLERDPLTGEPTGRVVPGGFGDAFEQLTGIDFDTWSATLTFGYPLQNRAARARRTSAELAVERERAALEDLKAGIVTEVRTATRALETAAKQIEAARASRVFQERNLDAERKRYENGMSTSYRINEIQEDLAEARSREVTAVTTYRRALADYYLATGRLLEEKGIDIADQEAEVERFTF